MTRFVLSLDAGGIKPLVIAGSLLEKLQEDTRIKIQDLFSMYAGTSGGAITAALLGLGLSPGEVQHTANLIGSRAFQRSITHRVATLNGVWGAKYDITKLHDEAVRVFGAYRMSAFPNPVILTTTDITNNRAVYIKSHSGANTNWRIADAVTASSAAPFYFYPFRGRYIDGGVHAYTPVLSVYAEARRFWPDDQIIVVSIGSGEQETTKVIGNPLKTAKDLVGGLFAATVDSHHWIADRFCRSYDMVFRFSPAVLSPMDDTSAESLSKLVEVSRVITRGSRWKRLVETAELLYHNGGPSFTVPNAKS